MQIEMQYSRLKQKYKKKDINETHTNLYKMYYGVKEILEGRAGRSNCRISASFLIPEHEHEPGQW